MNQKSNKVNHFWPAGRKNVIQSDVPVSKAAWHVRRAEEFARSIKGKVDLSLVKEMARAGCKEVSLGFESGIIGCTEEILDLRFSDLDLLLTRFNYS